MVVQVILLKLISCEGLHSFFSIVMYNASPVFVNKKQVMVHKYLILARKEAFGLIQYKRFKKRFMLKYIKNLLQKWKKVFILTLNLELVELQKPEHFISFDIDQVLLCTEYYFISVFLSIAKVFSYPCSYFVLATFYDYWVKLIVSI